MRCDPRRLLCLLVVVACVAFSPRSGAAEAVDYTRQVKPLLAARCTSCHGVLAQKSKLRLDTAEFIRKGGTSGAAIVPGKSGDSLLIHAVTGNDRERMPPEKDGAELSKEQIALLKAWIDQGAVAPADEPVPQDPRKHWAFQKPIRPAVPKVSDREWAANPIDAFIHAEHDRHKLKANPIAEKAVLLRRVTLDLTGLPPTREQLHSFLKDTSPDAYEKVVDHLLTTSEYGERWARHWMDVWRYCDWHGSGNEIRYSQRHIWRWRDWIIRSLNEDKGYDRMIVEMLAGDEVAPDDANIAAATGFIGRNWYKFDRNVWMRELVEHTAIGFLGLTFKCARCHDHKFDPITQKDYYRLRAFFEPHGVRTDHLSAKPELEAFADEGRPVLKEGVSRVYDKSLDVPTYLFERGDDRYPLKDRPLQPGLPVVLGGPSLVVKPVKLPVAGYAPMLQPKMLAEFRKLADEQVSKAETGSPKWHHAKSEREALEARIAADVAKHVDRGDAKRIEELSATAAKLEREATVKLAEVNLSESEKALAAITNDDKSKPARMAAENKLADRRKSLENARAALKKTDGAYTPLGEVYPTTSTGRRLALARWLTDRGNPLTARVAVNQIWLRHFGTPLMSSVADFGLRSQAPTHPDLLDWLAVELMESNWSMKKLHRLIVTSRAYRTSSVTLDESNRTHDTANRYLWHYPSRRLEAEGIRDSLLAISGTLDRMLGGREIPAGQEQTVPRRSLYFQTAPNRQSVMLQLFDGASTEECYERKPSVIPQQAYGLLNSPMAVTASKKVASRHEKLNDGEFVVAVFEDILNRSPSSSESSRCVEFVKSQRDWLTRDKAVKEPSVRARENLTLTLFNHNEFVTIR